MGEEARLPKKMEQFESEKVKATWMYTTLPECLGGDKKREIIVQRSLVLVEFLFVCF